MNSITTVEPRYNVLSVSVKPNKLYLRGTLYPIPSNAAARRTGLCTAVRYNQGFVMTECNIKKFYCKYEIFCNNFFRHQMADRGTLSC